MAEFCVDCWNEMNESNYSADSFILSEYLDLCEGCGEYKNVIIKIRRIDRKEWLF